MALRRCSSKGYNGNMGSSGYHQGKSYEISHLEVLKFHHTKIYSRAPITSQISGEEISFLTEGDNPNDDSVVLKKLFHPNLSLLLVSEGKDGCRYYTKVCL